MHENHIHQIDEGSRKSLLSAGIGRAYHKRSLSELPNGEALIGLIKNNYDDIATGTGMIFRGDTPLDRDAFILTARAIHKTGMSVRHMALARLSGKLIEDYDEYANISALFIARFQDETECPLREFERARVEALIDERADNALPTFVWISSPISSTVTSWWSRATMNRLADMNTVAPR